MRLCNTRLRFSHEDALFAKTQLRNWHASTTCDSETFSNLRWCHSDSTDCLSCLDCLVSRWKIGKLSTSQMSRLTTKTYLGILRVILLAPAFENVFLFFQCSLVRNWNSVKFKFMDRKPRWSMKNWFILKFWMKESKTFAFNFKFHNIVLIEMEISS